MYLRLLRFGPGTDYGDDLFLVADTTEDEWPDVNLVSVIRMEVGDDGQFVQGVYLNGRRGDMESVEYVRGVLDEIAAADVVMKKEAARAKERVERTAEQAKRNAEAERNWQQRHRLQVAGRWAGRIAAAMAVTVVVGGVATVVKHEIDTYCGTDCQVEQIDAQGHQLTDGKVLAIGEEGHPEWTFQATQGEGMGSGELPQLGPVHKGETGGVSISAGDTPDTRVGASSPRQIILSSDESNTGKAGQYCEGVYVRFGSPDDKVVAATDSSRPDTITVKVSPTRIDVCQDAGAQRNDRDVARVVIQIVGEGQALALVRQQ